MTKNKKNVKFFCIIFYYLKKFFVSLKYIIPFTFINLLNFIDILRNLIIFYQCFFVQKRQSAFFLYNLFSRRQKTFVEGNDIKTLNKKKNKY